jgi:hypothetical protein
MQHLQYVNKVFLWFKLWDPLPLSIKISELHKSKLFFVLNKVSAPVDTCEEQWP